MVFTAAGLLTGAKTFGLVDPVPAGETVKLLAEATLAVVLFSDAARIDLAALRDEFRVPARLLGIGLPLTILAGFLAALLLFGSFAWPEALVLAVILAPTDAALGQAVVTLPSLPSQIRQGLNVESGLNDGICVPILAIALAIASTEAGNVHASHAVTLVAEEIGYGVLVGAAAGAVTAAVIVFAGARGLVEPSWLQVVPLAGAALAYTTAAAIGGSGFIAAFVAGMVFGGLRRRAGGELGYLLEELGSVLGAATFVVFGAVLLGPALGSVTWAVAAYALLSLTHRAHGPGGDRDGRDARPPADARLPRLVRSAGARLDRVRDPRRGGAGRAAERERRAHHRLRHDRPVRAPARRHCRPAGAPLRRVVPDPSAAGLAPGRERHRPRRPVARFGLSRR